VLAATFFSAARRRVLVMRLSGRPGRPTPRG
jgi:hypothetical protein